MLGQPQHVIVGDKGAIKEIQIIYLYIRTLNSSLNLE
jgi:hypothetical protein